MKGKQYSQFKNNRTGLRECYLFHFLTEDHWHTAPFCMIMERYLSYCHETLDGIQTHYTKKLPVIYDYDVLVVLSKDWNLNTKYHISNTDVHKERPSASFLSKILPYHIYEILYARDKTYLLFHHEKRILDCHVSFQRHSCTDLLI